MGDSMNEQITDSLAWLVKSVQDIPYGSDLTALKFVLKDMKIKVDTAYSLVDKEINNNRRSKNREGRANGDRVV